MSQLIDSCTQLSWQESVALVRSLAAVSTARAPGVPSTGTFGEFLIHDDGRVTTVTSAPPSLSVSELALLLTRLLPGGDHDGKAASDSVSAAERAPAALHFAIARALALVDAPSYVTVEEFSAALSRFQAASPRLVLRQMFDRCLSAIEATQPAREHLDASEGGTVSYREEMRESHALMPPARAAGSTFAGPDRRRSQMPSDVLRRLLREEDRRNYLDLRSRAAAAKRERKAGPDAQTLRRLIREADERTYALMRDVEMQRAASGSRRPPRRTGYHAAFAMMMVLLTAAGVGIVERDRLWPRDGRGVVPALDATVSGRAAPAAGALQASAAAVPVEAAASSVAPPAAPASGPAKDVRVAMPDRTRHASATSKRVKRTVSATSKRTTKAAVVATKSSDSPVTARRRGPVPRFFAEIYHRLGSLVKRDTNVRPEVD